MLTYKDADFANNTGERINIAIIGGGIAGLCLALGTLKQASHTSIHIYEAAQQFAEIGAGVAFGINAQRALWSLDERLGKAYSRLRTSNADSNIVVSNAQDELGRAKQTYIRVVMGMAHASNEHYKAGTEVCEVFCEGGFSSVHRARFLEELIALLPQHFYEECVTFGARLVSTEKLHDSGRVRLLFADGRTAVADAVIGCDGIKSQLRQELLGTEEAQPIFTGKYAYRGLIPMDQAVAALGDRSARNAHHRIGYGGHVLTFPIDKGKTMNVVAFRTKTDGKWPEDDDWIKTASQEQMQADFKGWGSEVHSILTMMERTDMWALFDLPDISTYHREGSICLIGDAAHASTPHQGSGAGMALEDALLISRLLHDVNEKKELEDVFAAFEVVRKERTRRLVSSSREQAMLYDFEAVGIGDDVEKIAAILPHRWDWLWDHDLEQEHDNAKITMTELRARRYN